MMMTISIISFVQADDPYRFFDWRVTYGNISPLGIPQRVFFFFSNIHKNGGMLSVFVCSIMHALYSIHTRRES